MKEGHRSAWCTEHAPNQFCDCSMQHRIFDDLSGDFNRHEKSYIYRIPPVKLTFVWCLNLWCPITAVSCPSIPSLVIIWSESCSLILVLCAESEPGTVVCLALSSPSVLDLESAEVRATLHDLDVPHVVEDATPISAGKEGTSSIALHQAARS